MLSELAMRRQSFLIAAVIIVFDQAAKWVVNKEIALHESITVVPGLLDFTHEENRGAVFGIFSESPSEWKITLVLLSVVALTLLSALLWKSKHLMMPTGMGWALILGGAVGNLLDRLLSGQVVDFLYFHSGDYYWPAFNFADIAIVIGTLLLAKEILFSHDNTTLEKPADNKQETG